MKGSTWVISGLGATALAVLLAWAFAPRPVEVEVAPVTQGRFDSSIDEDGKTRLRDRYVVSAPLAGRLSRITLREGDPVEADAVVATLTPMLSPLLDERTLLEQQAHVEAAQANVHRTITRIERAKVSLEQARNEVRRTEQLAQQGFVSPTKLDGDRLAALAAQKELDASVEERHIAGHDLEQARAALGAVRRPAGAGAGASTGARAFAVRAPAAGRVLRVAQGSEGTVALGTPLLEIGDTARLEIVAELLTSDALQARPGSPVRIERWGGPAVLLGQVRRVEPAAFTKVSALGVEEQRVNVLIDITSPADQWRSLGDGFRVGVRIVTLTQDNAVLVPVSALFPLPAGAPADAAEPVDDTARVAQQPMSPSMQRWAVFVHEGGRVRLAPVLLGGRNGSQAWVRDGVAPGASVIVYPPAAVRDGARAVVRRVQKG